MNPGESEKGGFIHDTMVVLVGMAVFLGVCCGIVIGVIIFNW